MEFVLFYGNKEIYSNFYPAEFEINGKKFPTSEHYFMYAKAMKFDPEGPATYEKLASASPAEAKQLGRQVRFFSESAWSAVDKEIMYTACLAKFSQNPELKQQILETGDAIIVECSPRDRKWGIGMGKNNPDAQNPDKWRGRNLLGETLMRVREKLQEGLTDDELKRFIEECADNQAVKSMPVKKEKPIEKIVTEAPLPNIKVGGRVNHKIFKTGVVKEIANGKIVVAFDVGDKTFVFPNVINDGFLEMERSK